MTTDKNRLLAAAKAGKNDEFYTQWAEIEREMNAYLSSTTSTSSAARLSYSHATILNGQTSRSSSPSTSWSSV